jgi:hypothetical protein
MRDTRLKAMNKVTPAFLNQQLELAEQLQARRATAMLAPQDLPGRYGRVIKAIDHLLQISQSDAVLSGGWAVWRYGFVGRVTQDVDIVLAANQVDEFLRLAAVSGFDVLPRQPGRWPKLLHRDTDVEVDILPEGGRPGTASHPAPTTIPHPSTLGAQGSHLTYIRLDALVGLKLGAGRARDEADIVELVRANPDQTAAIRQFLGSLHPDYVTAFDKLVERAREQTDE